MADSGNPRAVGERPWTRQDEENLLLEIIEDSRLRNLGIDPDADPLAILIALKMRMAEINSRKPA